MKIIAYCDGCRHRHPIEFDPCKPDNQIDDWRYKHSGVNCRVWFDWPERTRKPSWVDALMRPFRVVLRWVPWLRQHVLTAVLAAGVSQQPYSPLLAYLPNAAAKVTYAASVAYTFTSLNSLASDTNLLAGASSLAVDNTSNLYLDYYVAGLIKNNTSSTPTAGTYINVYAYRAYDDTPTYPDTLLGTDATKTITTGNILNSLGRQLAGLIVAATTSQVNPWDAGLLSQYFGGVPSLHALFVVQNSGQTLAATGNTQTYKGQYVTIA